MKKNVSLRCFAGLICLVIVIQTRGSNQTNTYDPAGRLVAADYGSGKSTSYAYDKAGNLIQSSQPSPGLVVGTIVSGQLTFAWPSSPGGFILESTPVLGVGAVWSPVGIVPTPVVNRSVVILSVTQTNQFFRLRK